jgi:hypothetical protein
MRRALIVLILFVTACCLASCSSDGQSNALGHEACVDASRSIKTFDASQHALSPVIATKDRASALGELRDALRPAALAGSSDGDWQALMATLSESSRVPENLLVPALNAQCAATLGSS